MKSKLFATLFAFVCACGIAHAMDLNEIQKLKEMGFTNEQIVEMTKSANNNATPNGAKTGISAENINRVNEAKKNNNGLLLIWASKEYPDRGPGHIDIFKNNEKIGSIELNGYVSNGPATHSKTDYSEYSKKNKWTSGTSSTTIANTICSRYLGDFELPAGTYEIKLERNLYVGDPTSSLRGKARRHKIFHNVTVETGKVTMLSYYWQDNENFGKDIVISTTHKQSESEIAESWGDSLLKVVEK